MIYSLLPEISIFLTATLLLFFPTHPLWRRRAFYFSIFGIISALVLSFSVPSEAGLLFGRVICLDETTVFFRTLFFTLGIIVVLFLKAETKHESVQLRELHVLILLEITAFSIMALSANLVLTFVTFQLVNLGFCMITTYGRDTRKRTDAAVRYFLFSLLSGVFFLVGLGILFSLTYDVQLNDLMRLFHEDWVVAHARYLRLAFVFWIVSLSFPIGVFPMSWMMPELMERVGFPVSLLASIGVRFSGLAGLIRILKISHTAGEHMAIFESLASLIQMMAGLALAMGAILALTAKSRKSFLGSIVLQESGVLLLSVAQLLPDSMSAMFSKMMIDLFALSGLFLIFSLLERAERNQKSDSPKSWLHHVVPLGLIACFLSLIGITAGFGLFASFGILGATLRGGNTGLVVLAIMASVSSLIGALRVTMDLIEEIRFQTWSGHKNLHAFLIVAVLIPLFFLILFPGTLFHWSTDAARGFILAKPF